MTHQPTIAIAALFVAAAGAAGQGTTNPYAPSGSNASRLLQVETSPLPGGNFARPNLADEVRFRNAIITGNVPGGISFRGNAGYRDPGDFQARLGSDSTFNFRRDSFASGLGGLGLRGTDALQYQFTFTTGNAATFTRGGPSGRTLQAVRREILAGSEEDETDRAKMRGGWTESAIDFGAMRSTASFAATRGLNPAVVAARPTALGIEQIVASPLLGIRMDLTGRAWFQKPQAGTPGATSPAGQNPPPSASGANSAATTAPAQSARTAYDDLRARLDATGQPVKAGEDPGTVPPGTTPTPSPGTTPPGVSPTKPTDSPQPAEGAPVPEWERRMDALREALDRRIGLAPAPTRPGADATEPAPEASGTDTGEKPVARAGDKPDTRVTRGWLDDETLRILREHAGAVNAYVAGEPADFFGENVRAAQKMMSEGRYFDAEERFARALSFKPGEPAAMAGRLNAQLGAGMFVSGAINLRDLFQRHPEVIGLRYTGATMPSLQRQEQLATILRDNIKDTIRPATSVPRESALLLAYLGYQRADRAMTGEGLDYLANDAMRRAEPPDRLVALLREVWLAPEAPAGGPGR